jgi:hypothetical protein
MAAKEYESNHLAFIETNFFHLSLKVTKARYKDCKKENPKISFQ